jgi:hypothetical protein
MDLITAIRLSMRVFVCGMFAIVPLIGFVPAVYAVVCWSKVRARYRDQWNPAAQYLHWGTLMAVFGALFSTLAVVVVIMLAQLAAME